MPSPRRGLTPGVQATLTDVAAQLEGRPQLAALFAGCFPNTLQTTLEELDGGRTFVFTGDIPAMWLRDSAAQVSPYVHLCAHDAELRGLVAGVIRQQAHLLSVDPYANAFNLHPGHEYSFDVPPPGPWVWERKFELDSLLFPVWLTWRFWKATGGSASVNGAAAEDATLGDLRPMFRTILEVMQTEQRHATRSEYLFERPAEYCVLPSDTLPRGGRGAECAPTGMVWSGFRPSDDACTYPYLVPANMFAVVALRHMAELARGLYGDEDLAGVAARLEGEIEAGIREFAVVEHPEFGQMYAYETDGLGRHLLMDDANVPSLLSLPYLGYCEADDPVYLNTRRFILSEANPHFHRGEFAAGVGSPHTPGERIWPIALCMQALTVQQTEAGRAEAEALLRTLSETTADTYLMHESFDPNDPAAYSRPWFAWANSLLAETVLRSLGRIGAA